MKTRPEVCGGTRPGGGERKKPVLNSNSWSSRVPLSQAPPRTNNEFLNTTMVCECRGLGGFPFFTFTTDHLCFSLFMTKHKKRNNVRSPGGVVGGTDNTYRS